jgi:hypothetical protein
LGKRKKFVKTEINKLEIKDVLKKKKKKKNLSKEDGREIQLKQLSAK